MDTDSHAVSLIVVNYRTPGDLGRFLRSVDGAVSIEHDVWVINNAPERDDKYAAWDGHIRARNVINHRENLGYAQAVNHAVAQCGYDTIAVFNADVVLQPTSVDRCVARLWSEPDWGILGPRQLDSNDRITHAGIFGPDTNPRHRGWHHRDNPQFHDVRDDCYSVSGAAYFVRRDVWNELTFCPIYRNVSPKSKGAFLDTFLYHEESWCSVHARSHGWKVVYDGEVWVRHEWHRSIKKAGEGTHMADSKKMFVAACEAHGLEHN